MPARAGLVGLGTVAVYLVLFFLGTAQAARAAGRPVWLFGRATGAGRLAAIGFRAAFALTLAGPLVWIALPALREADPLWARVPALAPVGAIVASAGAMIAFAAQMPMGVSWRVGVAAGEAGPLVTGGIYRISRNPTFLGQALLLAGAAVATPSLPTAFGVAVLLWSASVQIRQEEQVLRATHGAAHAAWAARVPRWFGIAQR